MEEATYPRNAGCLLDPDAFALIKAACGNTMDISIRVEDDKIAQALFLTNGPGPAIACGSMLTTMIEGLSVADAYGIRAEDLVTALDGLPEARMHCAELAVAALHEAIRSWQGRKEEREHEWL